MAKKKKRRLYGQAELMHGEYVMAGERLDYRWTHEDVAELRTMYNEGYSLTQMSRHFDRRVSEILIMIDDLLTDGKLTKGRKLTLK